MKKLSLDSATAIRISIIIVIYNSRSYLDGCLGSLLETIGSDTEIILIDNGSSDNSCQSVARSFPRVRLHRASRNSGYAGGNNLGARLAQGEFLVFLNPDTKVTPGWLEPLVEALDNTPHSGLATPKIMLMSDPERINTGGNDIHCTGLTCCRGFGMDSEAMSQPSRVAAVSGAAFLIRRDLYTFLGGFDQSFFMYMEDTDLCWRATLAGWDCLYVPESIVYHDYALRFGPRKVYYQERNRYLMLLKNLRWRTIALLLPIYLLAEFVTWSFVLIFDRPNLTNKFLAYGWVWRHRSQIICKHKQIQSLRRITDKELLSRTTYTFAYEQIGSGRLARLAHWILDPMFALLRWISLFLIRW